MNFDVNLDDHEDVTPLPDMPFHELKYRFMNLARNPLVDVGLSASAEYFQGEDGPIKIHYQARVHGITYGLVKVYHSSDGRFQPGEVDAFLKRLFPLLYKRGIDAGLK